MASPRKVSSPQDIMDALKERLEAGASYRNIDASNYPSLQVPPAPPPPVVSPVNHHSYRMLPNNEGEAPPVDKNRVFKMTYETRDIHSAAIPAGSMNVINSLKEKIAEKNKNSASYQPKKTPSRLHAMLQDQFGQEGSSEPSNHQTTYRNEEYDHIPVNTVRRSHGNIPPQSQSKVKTFDAELYSQIEQRREQQQHSDPYVPEDQNYERFRSDQSKQIPSKVFQALQYCYPAQENQGIHQNQMQSENEEYERFRGNKGSAVPSKVFQALQYSYPSEGSSETQTDNMQYVRSQNWEDGNVGMRSSRNVPSKVFKMLQKQYSDETESVPPESINNDLQDALDLLEKELESMTASKRNPVITVPLTKGVQMPKPHNSHSQQSNPAAPPVPIRVDSKKFKIPSKVDEEEEEIMEAPVARIEPALGNRRHSSKSGESTVHYAPAAMINNVSRHNVGKPSRLQNLPSAEDGEYLVAPLPHVERVVAYSAEIETPWLNQKKGRTNPALSIRHQNAAASERRASASHRTRSDSYDSTSSHSSQQERLPEFDPDTYVVTRKSSTSSHGIRSNSTDSSHSYSSYASGQEPRYDEETDRSDPRPAYDQQQHRMQMQGNKVNEIPRKMVINVNGRSRASHSLDQDNRDFTDRSSEHSNHEIITVSDRESRRSSCDSVSTESSETRERLPSAMKITISTKAIAKPNQNNQNHNQYNQINQNHGNQKQSNQNQYDQSNQKHGNLQQNDQSYHNQPKEDAKSPEHIKEKDDSELKCEMPQRMPTPLNNLQEMMNLFQVDEFEKEVKRRGSGALVKNNEDSIQEDEEEICQEMHVANDRNANGDNDFSKLEALKLEDLNSEELNEVYVQDVESSLMSKLENDLHSRNGSQNDDHIKQGKPDETDNNSKKINSNRPLTAVHVQSRKQQQQLSCTRSGATRNPKKERRIKMESNMSPPVNIQMQKSPRRCSMPLESLVDDYKADQSNTRTTTTSTESSSPSKIPVPVSLPKQNSNSKEKQDGDRSLSVPRTPVRDDSIIVPTEVYDNDDLSAEKLQKTFEMINATADRILDQIDKVGSLGDFSDEFEFEKYSATADEDVFVDQRSNGISKGRDISPRRAENYEDVNRISLRSDGSQKTRGSSSSSSSLSPSFKENGYKSSLHYDENLNNYDPNDYHESNHDERFEEVFAGSNDCPYRVSKKVVSSVKRTSTGVKITMPAFSVKVSQGSSRPQAGQSSNSTKVIPRTARK